VALGSGGCGSRSACGLLGEGKGRLVRAVRSR
jgi:hypothetical protein